MTKREFRRLRAGNLVQEERFREAFGSSPSGGGSNGPASSWSVPRLVSFGEAPTQVIEDYSSTLRRAGVNYEEQQEQLRPSSSGSDMKGS
jgi:hypothetical protein